MHFSYFCFWSSFLFLSIFVLYPLANAVFLLVLQAALSFDGMAGKTKVADVNDAFSLVDTMYVGDLFVKKSKKNSRKSSDPLKETSAKKARLASARPLLARRLLKFQALSCRVSLDFMRSIFV